MREIQKLLVIGGDKRQLHMAQALRGSGYQVSLCAFGEHEGFETLDFCAAPLETAIPDAQAVILPLPASRDGVCVNAPFSLSPPKLETVLEALSKEQIVFAGMLSREWKSAFFQRGIPVFDYFEREELAVYNAIPTAQGVIKTALDHIDFTLHGANCAVTGYGRTAKVLANALRGLGTQVTVAVRKYRDIAWAQADGHRGIYLQELPRCAERFDILVNTVPVQILGEAALSRLRRDCLLIEIASEPYGIDFRAAEALGLKVIVAPSLPGKVAPKTAGKIISDVIHTMIGAMRHKNDNEQ